MKRILFFMLPALFFLNNSYSQQRVKDSLKTLLKKEKRDTARVRLLNELCFAYYTNKPDTAMVLALEALNLSNRIGFLKGEAASLNRMGNVYGLVNNVPKALEVYLQALKLNEKINNLDGKSRNFVNLGNIYSSQEEYRQAIGYLLKAKKLSEQLKSNEGVAACSNILGVTYLALKKYDSARIYSWQAYQIGRKFKLYRRTATALYLMGDIYSETRESKLALEDYRLSIPYAQLGEFSAGLSHALLGMAKLFANEGREDSALSYAKRSFNISRGVGKFNFGGQKASDFLYSLYKKRGNTDSALFYLETSKAVSDSSFSQQKINQFYSLDFDEKMRQQEILQQQEQYANQVKMYGLIAIVLGSLVIAMILWRNNRLKQKANEKIQKTLTELKTTQNQLIQSEKMASLGELTAGIAHEIQNPLNFVNNFSEVNTELIAEMKQEIEKGDLEEIKAIAVDIEGNSKKISMHGKRADAIVKGMLQHSQSSSGTKEPTNINTLADEYLRLAYHGLRAKDKEFNAELLTNFDKNLPKVEVIPQDIGRVLLNIFNNALYAVNQKQKISSSEYKPIVEVTTEVKDKWFIITIKDNGNGIPESIRQKIMQPFFTTKPTGEGTGLGLSLSYDIIVKGHSGSIDFTTKEGEFTEFVVKLPIT